MSACSCVYEGCGGSEDGASGYRSSVTSDSDIAVARHTPPGSVYDMPRLLTQSTLAHLLVLHDICVRPLGERNS